MTPAEKEALRVAAEKARESWAGDCTAQYKDNSSGLGNIGVYYYVSGAGARLNTSVADDFANPMRMGGPTFDRASYIAAANPEAILSLLSDLSSMELTLANATSAGKEQMARIATLEASGKWIPVDQELPPRELDTFVLAKFTEQFMSTPGMYNRRPCEVVSTNYLAIHTRIYTHWMHIPAAPTEPTHSARSPVPSSADKTVVIEVKERYERKKWN